MSNVIRLLEEAFIELREDDDIEKVVEILDKFIDFIDNHTLFEDKDYINAIDERWEDAVDYIIDKNLNVSNTSLIKTSQTLIAWSKK